MALTTATHAAPDKHTEQIARQLDEELDGLDAYGDTFAVLDTIYIHADAATPEIVEAINRTGANVTGLNNRTTGEIAIVVKVNQ